MVEPRFRWAPEYKRSFGLEACALAAGVGLVLDDWQTAVLTDMCAVDADGKWVAFEVGINVARQNGKNSILTARELAGIELFGERLIVHTAHLVDTSLEAMERFLDYAEDAGIGGGIRAVRRTNGREAIIFQSGQRIRFRTRTRTGGRGFSADCVVFDEAMELPEKMLGAVMPTMSARPNPQAIYAGSAADQEIMEHSVVWSRVRHRGIGGGDPSLVYFEWSANLELEDVAHDEGVLDERAGWRAANPAIDIRIGEDYIEKERRSMDPRTFAVERLGVGDWPSIEQGSGKIDLQRWNDLVDPESELVDPVCLAVAVTPDRSRTAIAAAGRRYDGLAHVEIAEHRRGTGWVAKRVAEMVAAHEVANVSIASGSPAAALVRPLEQRGVTVDLLSIPDQAQACGVLEDMVTDGTLRHLGTAELQAAIRSAQSKPVGDSWVWSLRLSQVDISPLVAATLSVWQAADTLGSVYDDRGLVTI